MFLNIKMEDIEKEHTLDRKPQKLFGTDQNGHVRSFCQFSISRCIRQEPISYILTLVHSFFNIFNFITEYWFLRLKRSRFMID